jgi:hypothetical protein
MVSRYGRENCFYFGVLHPVARTVPPNNSSGCLFYIFLPLHVPAIVGHLQAEYTTILGRYLTRNRSVVLCYRSRLLCMLPNTAVIFLIFVCELSKLGQTWRNYAQLYAFSIYILTC